MDKKYNVAVVGVGMVGIELLRILKERKFPINKLRVFARSARTIDIDGYSYDVEAIDSADFSGIDIALFAGTEGEKGAATLYADKFIKQGSVVIDNGADFRLKEGVPLIVPEVNRHKISSHKGLIANPNCTTIQMVVALGGIYKRFGLEQIILTSFQSVSGAGRKAVGILWDEIKEIVNKNLDKEYDKIDKNISHRYPDTFTRQIAFNVIPQIGGFQEGSYTSEEWKVVKETHKIFDDDTIKISATCVRVPSFISHAEAIYFKTRERVTIKQIENVLLESEGVKFFSSQESFPVPLDAEGKNDVFVGRLRKDPFEENSFWIWVVADNLRKGAALNAIQIAELLLL